VQGCAPPPSPRAPPPTPLPPSCRCWSTKRGCCRAQQGRAVAGGKRQASAPRHAHALQSRVGVNTSGGRCTQPTSLKKQERAYWCDIPEFSAKPGKQSVPAAPTDSWQCYCPRNSLQIDSRACTHSPPWTLHLSARPSWASSYGASRAAYVELPCSCSARTCLLYRRPTWTCCSSTSPPAQGRVHACDIHNQRRHAHGTGAWDSALLLLLHAATSQKLRCPGWQLPALLSFPAVLGTGSTRWCFPHPPSHSSPFCICYPISDRFLLWFFISPGRGHAPVGQPHLPCGWHGAWGLMVALWEP